MDCRVASAFLSADSTPALSAAMKLHSGFLTCPLIQKMAAVGSITWQCVARNSANIKAAHITVYRARKHNVAVSPKKGTIRWHRVHPKRIPFGHIHKHDLARE